MNGNDLGNAVGRQIINLILIAALAGVVVGGIAVWVLS